MSDYSELICRLISIVEMGGKAFESALQDYNDGKINWYAFTQIRHIEHMICLLARGEQPTDKSEI